jgi:L,D-transpeptidase ErfK/SrfK
MVLIFSFLFLLTASTLFGADMIIGGITQYTVQKGDRLELIGAKLGVYWRNIAIENGLDPKAKPTPGQELKVTTRKIVPKIVEDGIIINIADRTLYYFKGGKLTAYPVGVGLPSETEFGDWRTPTSKFVITGKRKNPTWAVPDSIQMELAFKGRPIEEFVPPGPKNPLGRYAIQTSIPGVLIHETIWPASVYRFQSHGCIRMLPQNIEKLFEEVEKGTKGEIIYEPIKAAVDNKERIFLEVRTDTYRRLPSVKDHVWKLLGERGLTDKVNAVKVEQVIKGETGIAEDITLYPQASFVLHKKTLFQRLFDFFRSRPGNDT